MKASMLVPCCAIAMLLLLGCAHEFEFLTVDASTGSVLSGVDVKRRKVTSFSYFEHELGEKAVGSTDNQGLITLRGVTTKDVIYFDATGYRGAAVALEKHGVVKISWSISPPMAPFTTARLIVTNTAEPIIIPLNRLSNSR